MLPPDMLLPRLTLVFALLLAIVGDQLLWGVGFSSLVILIWLTLFVAAATWLARSHGAPWWRQIALWGGVALLAAALGLLVAIPDVNLAMLLVMTMAAAQILLRTAGIGFMHADVYQQALAHMLLPVQALTGGFRLLARLEFKLAPAHPRVIAAVRGLLLAMPLLVVFSLLFAAADVTFEQYLGQLPALFSPTILQHLLLMLAVGWLSLGLLTSAWQARHTRATPTLNIKLGDTELIVLMGLLALLFVSFAALQTSHLLRDSTGIAQTTGLTIAQYARHGFFQLLVIAVLAQALLLVLASCCRNQRLFAGFAALLLVCVLIVLASAVQRMLFYMDSFGLSIDRVVASMVMLWLTGSMAFFAATVLRNRPQGFVSGVACLGMAVCLGFVMLNPAALVTRSNLERSLGRQQALDLAYLYKLGADAVPALLEYMPRMTPAQQCEISTALIAQWLTTDNNNVKHLQDWRRWNYAYYRAQSLLQGSSGQLFAAARRSGETYYNDVANLQGPPPAQTSCQ